MSQRWRITLARAPEGAAVAHRDLVTTWESIGERMLAESAAAAAATPPQTDEDADRPRGPVPPEPQRARVQFAAPLPTGMTADAELIDVLIPGRITRPRVRAIIEAALPAGVTLVDACDVWIAGGSLPSVVAAADVRAEVSGTPPAEIAAAIEALLARTVVQRPGRDPGRAASNLRPLIESAAVVAGGSNSERVTLRLRLRLDPALGSGRPEEVVEALAAFGAPLTLHAVHREGFRLREEERPAPPSTPAAGSGTRLRPVRRTRS